MIRRTDAQEIGYIRDKAAAAAAQAFRYYGAAILYVRGVRSLIIIVDFSTNTRDRTSAR